MFFILLLSVTLIVVLFLSFGFINKIDLSRRTKTIFHGLLVLATLLAIGGQFYARRHNAHVNELWFQVLSWSIYTTMGFLSLLFVCALVARVAWEITHRLRAKIQTSTDITRREHLSKTLGASVFATSTFGTLFGIREAHGAFDVKTVRMTVPHLPDSLRKIRIVQVSDVHIGSTIQRDFINRMVDTVNNLKADIFVITGDLVDGHPHLLAQHVKPLERVVASIGRYFVTGNHEYYWGADDWISHMTQSGYLPLLNEYVLCGKGEDKILLAGVTDTTAAQFNPEQASDPAKALRTAHYELDELSDDERGKLVKVLLAHRPNTADEAAKIGFDIQLSGHTHAGQYFPWTLVVHAFHKYVAGFHRVQNLQLYINRGTGYWGPPLRIGVDPEITLIELDQE